MFGMGFMEIMFIAIIAVIFLGPEKLPETMVDIARFFKKIKGTIANTKEELEKELQISDLKAEMLSYKSQLDDMSSEVKGVANGDMLKSELKEINKSIEEVATLDMDTQPSAPKEPEREVVTFEKKKTPVEKVNPTEESKVEKS